MCTRETLDLVYEMDRRGLFAFLVPSIFTPLHDTRMEHQTGVRTRQLSPLQWQLMMKCWKHNLRPDQYSWWGPMTWRGGSIVMWLYRLRKLNGPNFTWPLMMFAGVVGTCSRAVPRKFFPIRVRCTSCQAPRVSESSRRTAGFFAAWPTE